jgi:hypothetical protein
VDARQLGGIMMRLEPHQIRTINSCIAEQADPKPSIRRFVKIVALDSHDHGCPVEDSLMVENRVSA